MDLHRANPSDLSRARLVRDLLISSPFLNESVAFPKDGLSRFLTLAARRFGPGGVSALASQMGAWKGGFFEWTNGKHIPGLLSLIRLSEAFNCPIAEILMGASPPDVAASPRWMANDAGRIPRHQVKKIFIQNQLQRIHDRLPADQHFSSLSQIAKSLGVSRKGLANAYPDLTDAISNLMKVQAEARKEQHRNHRLAEFRRLAKGLAEQGIRPTRNLIGALIHGAAIFSWEEKRACESICREVRRELDMF